VIELHLDGRSRIATDMQLVQQVRPARTALNRRFDRPLARDRLEVQA
jgi:hypothetical protein